MSANDASREGARTLLEELVATREEIGGGDPLPDWSQVQWAIMLQIKGGDVALLAAVLDGMEPEAPMTKEEAARDLRKVWLAIAVIALDAADSLAEQSA